MYKSWSGKTPHVIVELWPIVVAEKWVDTAVQDQIEHTQLSFKKAEKLLLEAEGKTSDAKDQDIADGRRPDLKLTFGGWYGMVWYGMVWYGMVWYGMVTLTQSCYRCWRVHTC